MLILNNVVAFRNLSQSSLKQPIKKGKAINVTSRRGSYIIWIIGSQMMVRLSALRAGRPLRFLVFISVRG
jgi:hypothetical protein